jgi:hypothetical protein
VIASAVRAPEGRRTGPPSLVRLLLLAFPMRPKTVRDLLLGLGLTAGLGGAVEACSSQNEPPAHPEGAGGTTGVGGLMGNGPGGVTGSGGLLYGSGGNAVRGGAPGQLDAADDVTSDGADGNGEVGGPPGDGAAANAREDGG